MTVPAPRVRPAVPPPTPGRSRGRLVGRMRDRWRRSLQLRVVVSTTAVCAVVVALVGLVVMAQVRTGVLRTKEKAAVVQASAGLSSLQNRLTQLSLSDADSVESELLTDLESLSTQTTQAGQYDILLLATGDGPRGGEVVGDVDDSTITPRLRAAVAKAPSQLWQYVELRHHSGARSEPGLAVGGRLITPTGYTYQLYYVFPLSAEAATLALVQRTLFFAGGSLLLLLVAVAWLVTRQVVKPVQQAARIAELLAAGRLKERMAVRGEDELASLADSFNHMAASLQREIQALEELSRLQRRFVSDVSHELRTPLTTVRMAADVLHAARADFPPAVARSAELLQAELDRFEVLLVDLLEISRYDARAAVLEAESVDLVELVRAVVEASMPLAERTLCPLETVLPDAPMLCEVDPRRVQRILRNLVSNALEHGEGRPVVVALAGDDDAVAVTVRDHGIGLRPGESSLVFNRFWRADPARARSSGGTGLGLSIALEDARLHGGWLQAWGELGRGSNFRLTLPRRAGAVLQRAPLPLDPQDTAAEAVSG